MLRKGTWGETVEALAEIFMISLRAIFGRGHFRYRNSRACPSALPRRFPPASSSPLARRPLRKAGRPEARGGEANAAARTRRGPDRAARTPCAKRSADISEPSASHLCSKLDSQKRSQIHSSFFKMFQTMLHFNMFRVLHRFKLRFYEIVSEFRKRRKSRMP